MSSIATITAHPNDDTIVILRTPLPDDGTLMRGFEPATYSPPSRGYIVSVGMLSQLRRWLSRQGVHLVDERQTKQPASSTTGNPTGHDCETAGCVTFADWAARHPDLAQELLDGLDAIKARTKDLRTKR